MSTIWVMDVQQDSINMGGREQLLFCTKLTVDFLLFFGCNEQPSWVPYYENKHSACRVAVEGLPGGAAGRWHPTKLKADDVKQ